MGYSTTIILVFGIKIYSVKEDNEKKLLSILSKLWPEIDFNNIKEKEKFFDDIWKTDTKIIPNTKYFLLVCNNIDPSEYYIAVNTMNFKVEDEMLEFNNYIPDENDKQHFITFLQSKGINLPYKSYITRNII